MARLFRRILVPHDFSEHATGALKVAVDLAAENHGKVVVLHALPPFAAMGAGVPVGDIPLWFPPDDLVAAERARLEALVARVAGARGVAHQTSVVVGDPYQQIIAAASKVDLIVMSTSGRSGLAHLVIGSVAEKVVRHSPIPVLTLRPRAAARVGRQRAERRSRARSRAVGSSRA